MKYIIFLLGGLLLITGRLEAQLADSAIQVGPDSNRLFHYSVPLPELTQIPGAPAPFYTYLWDFGDGHFSFAENPVHAYQTPGDYDVIMYAVNNYDDGKKPQRRNRKVQVAQAVANQSVSPSVAEKDFFKANGHFELKYNCMAKPGDTMVLIAGWKNQLAQADGGKLYLLLNEKIFEQQCFDSSGFRFFNQERLIAANSAGLPFLSQPLTITESGSPAAHFVQKLKAADAENLLADMFAAYNDVYGFDLGEMAPAATRFAFLELYVTPEMIKDTNATLTITGVYVPEKGKPVMHKLNVPVVNSHDPNKMNIKGGRISYRFLKKHKPLDYKVRFQNNGKGPARKIALDITMASVLDPQTITVTDMSPWCPPCDSLAREKRGCWEITRNEKGALFTFHGIYLPGTDQKGVEDKDSTKGFMEFSIVTRKKLENRPFRSRTAIYFDRNEPVITNFATGRFKKSPSPVVMAGFEKSFTGKGVTSDGLVTGIGLAPLAPYLPFLQLELYYKLGIRTQGVSVRGIERPGVISGEDGRRYDYKTFDSSASHTIHQLKAVPLQIRYNFNEYISLGAGAAVTVDIGGETATRHTYYIAGLNDQGLTAYPVNSSKTISAFSNWRFQPFADLQLGKVKLGPHVGIRYYYNGKNSSFGYIYAGWRL
ncbi:hypothetical protein GCM10027051_02920 [Niabella terrae]